MLYLHLLGSDSANSLSHSLSVEKQSRFICVLWPEEEGSFQGGCPGNKHVKVNNMDGGKRKEIEGQSQKVLAALWVLWVGEGFWPPLRGELWVILTALESCQYVVNLGSDPQMGLDQESILDSGWWVESRWYTVVYPALGQGRPTHGYQCNGSGGKIIIMQLRFIYFIYTVDYTSAPINNHYSTAARALNPWVSAKY